MITPNNKVQDIGSSNASPNEDDMFDDSKEFTLYTFANKPPPKPPQEVDLDATENPSETYAYDDSSTDDSDFTSKVYQSRGCLGPIERMPLKLKLSFSIVLTLMGVIAFGAVIIAVNIQALMGARKAKKYSKITEHLGNAIYGLQTERSKLVYCRSLNLSFEDVEMGQAQNYTSNALQQFVASVHDNPNIFNQFRERAKVQQIQSATRELPSIRNASQYDSRVFPSAHSYSNIVSLFLDLMVMINENVPSSDPTYLSMKKVMVETEKMKEEGRQLRAIIMIGLMRGYFEMDETMAVTRSVSQYQASMSLASLIFPDEDIMRFNELFSEASESYSLFQNMTMTITRTIYSPQTIDPFLWWNTTQSLILDLEDFHSDKVSELKQITRRLRARSAGIVSVVVVVVIFVVVASIALGAFFSQTIVGPWSRILKLQEETMSKFVPKGFLRLMGRSNLYDVKLGDISSPNLDIFFADIRSFTTLSEKMGPVKTFEFLNAYLERIGPVFKRYSGFIDAYIGDGVMALFDQRPCWSISAAIEIQRRITKFNEEFADYYPELKLGIGIHSGDVSCGLVGSEGRVQGTMISDAVNTASRIESLTKRYGAKILVSQEALSNIPENCDIIYRYIGRVRAVGKDTGVDLYQILDDFSEADQSLYATKNEFEEAMNFMFLQPFDIHAACLILQKLTEANPNDVAAKLRYEQCEEMLADENLLASWDGLEVVTSK